MGVDLWGSRENANDYRNYKSIKRLMVGQASSIIIAAVLRPMLINPDHCRDGCLDRCIRGRR
jgi:hypothetical protein